MTVEKSYKTFLAVIFTLQKLAAVFITHYLFKPTLCHSVLFTTKYFAYYQQRIQLGRNYNVKGQNTQKELTLTPEAKVMKQILQ